MNISFKQFVEYDNMLNDSALLVIEKRIEPKALQSLANDLNEGFGAVPRFAGGLLGAASGAALGPAGAIPAAMAGSWLGNKVSNKVGNYFKGGQAPQVGQAFIQAKKAVENLISTMAAIQQQTQNPEISGVMQQGQAMQKALAEMEPQMPKVDQSLKAAHDTQAKQQGGVAQGLQRFGQQLQGQPIMAQAVDEPGQQGVNPQPQLLPQQKQNLWQRLKGNIGKGAEAMGDAASKFDVFNKDKGVRGAFANVGDKVTNFAQKHPNIARVAAPAAAALAGYGLGQYMHGGHHAGHQTTTAPNAGEYLTGQESQGTHPSTIADDPSAGFDQNGFQHGSAYNWLQHARQNMHQRMQAAHATENDPGMTHQYDVKPGEYRHSWSGHTTPSPEARQAAKEMGNW